MLAAGGEGFGAVSTRVARAGEGILPIGAVGGGRWAVGGGRWAVGGGAVGGGRGYRSYDGGFVTFRSAGNPRGIRGGDGRRFHGCRHGDVGLGRWADAGAPGEFRRLGLSFRRACRCESGLLRSGGHRFVCRRSGGRGGGCGCRGGIRCPHAGRRIIGAGSCRRMLLRRRRRLLLRCLGFTA